MIWGDSMKEIGLRLGHWEKETKTHSLQINLEKTVMLRLSRKDKRNTVMKISRSQIKQVNRFTYLRNSREKNSEIQYEINKRISKATKFYHLIKSIFSNKDIDSVKLQYTRCTLRRYCYMERRHGHTRRERKEKYKQLR
jgi:hypothetical protein